MRLQVSHLLAALIGVANAFAPSNSNFRLARRSNTARSLGVVEPSFLQELPNHVQSLQHAFTTISLSDAVDAMDGLMDTVQSAADTVQSAAPAAADAVDEAAGANNGWFGFLTGPTMGLLQLIHTGLVAVGVSADAWGVSIIALTILIKLLTFPLTKTQLESTNKMQALQPTIKDIQAKYQSNPEVMNQKIAEVYQTNQVNPLAGCLPSLVQIPIFIGLYRAVLDLAKEDKLNEAFLWLPSLEGPVYGADPTEGASWLFNWVDGVPPLGWDDTGAFLILPVLLVVSQFVSMEIMTPKNSEQQGNFILKLLPLMIGWFSLNVPSALTLYWFTNNIVTTATSVLIRNGMSLEPAMSSEGGSSAASPSASTIFAPPPMREKPAGFSSSTSSSSDDGVKPITSGLTSVVDAEIVDSTDADSSSESQPSTSASEAPKKRSRKKKRKKN